MKKIINYFKDNYILIIYIIIFSCGFILFETLVSEETQDLIYNILAIIVISLIVLLIIYGIIYKYNSRKK